MFGPLTFLLTIAQPAAAEEAAEPATVSLVGDADAAAKKKPAKGKNKVTSTPTRGPAEPPVQSSRPTPANGSAQKSSHPSRAPTARPVNTEDGVGTRAPKPENYRESRSAGHESAERSSGHESAERSSGGHESADRSSRGHKSADHRSAGHQSADHRAPSHAAAASRHRASRHAYASHHAAWVDHHRAAPWYRPWRAGRPVYWYHGVFVYGPPVVYVDGGHVETRSSGGSAPAPHRAVNREGKFSLGLTGGSYLSGFENGSGYGDAGLGLTASYRPVEPLAFQLSWAYHDASWSQGSARVQQPLQVSAELFLFPWSRVSPYVLAGVTMTDRNVDQPFPFGPDLETEQDLWGPHAGVGLEFAIGKRVALDFDARFIGYVNKPEGDPSDSGAVTANMGLNFYF